ncbi:MAG: hypothetical protein D3924_13580 [Candidatus Electrothrix sp. AR4]|nr:hypothetical protein [Candidatus Electrothrix sp. AR4]
MKFDPIQPSVMKKHLPFFLLVSTILLFALYGRPLWHPVLIKLRGGKTIAEVVEELRSRNVAQINLDKFERLVILGLKKERLLEVWGVPEQGESCLLLSLPFTGFSGALGPKLREWDGQIPEGVYAVEYLNPNSRYHLSVKINYPNAFDTQKGKEDGREKLGYDIFIHGKTATIGCIPLGDQGIENLFYLVAAMGKEKVEVIIAPYDMRKNDEPIDIPSISWEQELYAMIRSAIRERIPRPIAEL